MKRRRKELDLTQAKLAERASVSVFAIRKIEMGERRPSRQLAGLLAQALEVPSGEQAAFIKTARGELSGENLRQENLPEANFPRALTPFFGREPELSALGPLLSDPQCSLLTLAGTGGIGKTRLAIEAANRYKELFPDGVWFVPLAALSSPALLVSSIAGAINFRFPDPTNPQVQLLHYLQDKRALLVLDNAEHLLDGVGLFVEMLSACPQLKILVTSRERLNLLSEWVFEIKGLPVPASVEVEQFESYSSVALFVQSARRAQAGFELRTEDRRDVLKICQIVEGMPLGIEMSAAWIRTLSTAAIAAEIEQSLDFLSTSARDAPERHRSIQAVFDHSWKMLSAEEQQGLCRLSVFRGGFTREAAEEIAGIRLDVLFALGAKSLVQRDRQKRFSLHELVRQYAARQLETTGGTGEVQRRHITFFTSFAEKARDHFGGPQVAAWLEWMELDNENLRAALEYAIALRANPMALRLSAVLRSFWEYRGHLDEGRHWLKIILDLPGSDTEENIIQRGQALNTAGALARIQGDFAEARRLYEESLVLRRKSGDGKGIAAALNSLGILSMYEGKYAEAETCFQESLQLWRKFDNRLEIARRLNNLGVVAMYQGDYQKARLLHEECMGIHQELNDRHGVAGSLGNLGDVLRYQGEYDRAMEVLEESLALLQEIGDVHGTVVTLASMARVHLAKGNPGQALAAFQASLIQNRQVGDKTELASSLEGIAETSASAAAFAMRGSARTSPSAEDGIQLAVRLLAAADRLRSAVGAPRSAAERAEVEQIIVQLHSQLPEPDFTMEWKRGGEMTAEQAVEAALIMATLSPLPFAGAQKRDA